MNFLRSFFKPSSSQVIITIPSGAFYLKRSPNSIKGLSECLYKDAVATLRRTSDEFSYQLVIQRAYEEGEEELEGDEEDSGDDGTVEENDEEWAFLLAEDLHLTYTSNEEENIVIVWRDLDGDDGDHFEFVCDPETESGLFDAFDMTAKRCQYEQKYRKTWSGTSESDLDEFDFEPDVVTIQKTNIGSASTDKSKSAPVTPVTPVKPVKPVTPVTPAKQYDPPKPKVSTIKPVSGTKTYNATASLHLFDASTGAFTEQLASSKVEIYDQGSYEYWLEVDSDTSRFIGMPINSEMNPVFNFEHLAFTFNYFDKDSAFSWLLKFSSFDELDNFQEALMQSLWEANNKMKWAKVKPDDRDFLADTFNTLSVEDVDMEDADDQFFDADEQEETDEEDVPEKTIKKNVTFGNGTSDYDDDGEGFDKEPARLSGHGVNKELAVGHINDRSYVLRENMLGVFKQTTDEGLEFQTTIGNISNLKGKALNPEKILLHTKDTSMVLQDQADPRSLYKMDLEYGKVVEEWVVSENHNINAFAPSQKFAPSTDEQTLVGASNTGIFKIDPRLSGTKLVDSQLKNYATKMKFTSIATTEAGNLAVANTKGEIRLYDRLGVNAKTHLPAMGDPITGLDVSADGRWILATCSTYLLLIDALQPTGKTGFLKSFGRDSKPRPMRLQISPEHLAQMQIESGSPLSFNMAHFNTGASTKEQSIVTSSGSYVITWSMRKLLRGDKTPYLIKRYNEKVTAENFVYGTDRNVIIALEDDVGMVDRRTFRKPTRESLATPRRIQPLARNKVVNSPY